MESTTILAVLKMIVGWILLAIFWLAIIAIPIFLIWFWITNLIDCLKREFPNPNDKIIWVLVTILLSALGAFIYWLQFRRKA